MAENDHLPKEDRPDIYPDKPGLRSQEMSGGGKTPTSDADKMETDRFQPTDGESGRASSEVGDSLGAKDSVAPSPDENSGGRYNPNDSATVSQRTKQFLVNNRRKGLFGGGIVAVILAVVLGFTAIVPYELVNIEKNLIKDVGKIEQRFEKKAASNVMSHIVCRLLPAGSLHAAASGCTSSGDPQDNESDSEKAAEDADPLAKAMDSFDITDPAVMTALENQGIKVTLDANGNFAGLADANTGNLVTVDDMNNNVGGVFDRFETALPEWDVGQLKSFEPLMTEHAGSTFDGIPGDTAADDVDKTIEADVTNGASETDIINAEAGEETDGAQPDKNTSTQTATDVNTNNQVGGELGKSLDATNTALANGESGAQAVQDGVEAFSLSDPVFASGLATESCGLENSVDQSSKSRVPIISKLLTRHFTLLLSLADQLKTGKISGAVVNKVMQIFNGDPNATQTPAEQKDNLPAEASLPFTSSAGWQRATGGTVNTNPTKSDYTPDISESAKPTASDGTQIVNEIKAIPGLNVSCSALTGTFGFLVQGIANVTQVFSDIGSFGASQIGITAAIIAANETIQKVVLPDILKYFTPVGVYGGEDAVQWINNAHAGGVLAYSDYARSEGGQPLDTPTANSLTAEANHDQTLADARLPWSTRTFALGNPDSLVSRLAFDLPTSFRQVGLDFSSFFTNLPSVLGHSFGSLLMPRRVSALAATQNPGEAYGITEYGLTDNQVTKYDPIANEQYLETTITYNGKTATRLAMAGDPSMYQDGLVDSSTTDLLHCFLQNYDANSNDGNGDLIASETTPDPICASEGNYDMTTLPPQPITDPNVVVAYCNYLTGATSFTPADLVTLSGCMNAVAPQLNDDIGHYEQYLADTHVMNSYDQLTSNQ